MSEKNLEQKKITIDENKCIICCLCAQLYPEIFELKDNKISVINSNLDKVDEIIDSCPQGAIGVGKDG